MTDQSMTSIVEYQIRPENNTMAEWLAVWNDRGEDARIGEPETTAYAAAVNVDDPQNVLVFERYSGGEASLKKHMDRPAHAALMKAMGDRNMTKRRVTSARFADIHDYSWWSRPDRPGVVKDAMLLLLGMRFATPAMRQMFVEVSGGHANWCRVHEPETLVYSGGLALNDADRELDLKTGDLVFVMACTDMAAVEKHRDEPKHLALGKQFADRGLTLQSTFRRVYRTTGNGFLWR